MTNTLLMQYPIDLPRDYDMGIIRERVRSRGHLLDDRKGLACKVYGIRIAGEHGSLVNQYAPFYLWSDAGAAADFLWGGTGFDGIVRDFGRPTVHTWIPTATANGTLDREDVGFAQLRTSEIPRGADLTETAARLRDAVHSRSSRPEVHLALAGIDPTRWRTVEFTTSAEPATSDAAENSATYTVLHISQPAGQGRRESDHSPAHITA